MNLTAQDTMTTVLKAVEKLGYDLSEEDGAKVWEAFQKIATRKDVISSKELDTIVASSAMQVPATYILTSYHITASNTASSPLAASATTSTPSSSKRARNPSR